MARHAYITRFFHSPAGRPDQSQNYLHLLGVRQLTTNCALPNTTEHISAAGCCVHFCYSSFYFFILLFHKKKNGQDSNLPSCFVRFPPSFRSFPLTNTATFHSLSLSTPVGRFDGPISSSTHSFFPSSTFALNHECFTRNRLVSAHPYHLLFCLLSSYHLHPSILHSTNAASEQRPRSTSTNSGLPPIVIFCIVASGGTSFPWL